MLLILDIDAALMQVMAINNQIVQIVLLKDFILLVVLMMMVDRKVKNYLYVFGTRRCPTSTLNHLLTPCGFSPVYFWQAATAAPTRLNNSSDENSAMISDSISVTCNPGKHAFHRNRITGRQRSLR